MSTFLKDDFIDTPGTDLVSHTMDFGPGWSADIGTITDNGTSAVSGAGSSRYWSNAAVADAEASVKITLSGSSSEAGLVFRRLLSSDYWYVTGYAGDGNIYLYKVVSGSVTLVGSWPASVSSGVQFTLAIAVFGPSITVRKDGSDIALVTDGTHSTATGFGLLDNSGAADVWDNFLVQTIPGLSAVVVGNRAKLGFLADYTAHESLTVRLYVNTFTPTPAMVLGDFNELSLGGYSPQSLGGWSVPVLDGSGIGETTAAPSTWSLDGTVSFAIQGWFVTDASGNPCMAGQFASPINVNTFAFPVSFAVKLRADYDPSLA